MPNLSKTIQECQHYKDANFQLKEVIQGHKIPLLCQNYSSTFVYGPIFMKMCI